MFWVSLFSNKETNDEEKPFRRRLDNRDIERASGGAGAKELCRKHGVSDATFYKWRSMYGGMDVFHAKKLKALEAENAKLTKLLAEQMMDVSTLKQMLGKHF